MSIKKKTIRSWDEVPVKERAMHYHYFVTQDNGGQRFACITSTDEEAEKIRTIQTKDSCPEDYTEFAKDDKEKLKEKGFIDWNSYWDAYMDSCPQKYEEVSRDKFNVILRSYEGFNIDYREHQHNSRDLVTIALTNNGPGLRRSKPEIRISFAETRLKYIRGNILRNKYDVQLEEQDIVEDDMEFISIDRDQLSPEFILRRIEKMLFTDNCKKLYHYFIDNNEDGHFWTGAVTSDEFETENARRLGHYSEVDREKFLSAIGTAINIYKRIFRLSYSNDPKTEATITMCNDAVHSGIPVVKTESDMEFINRNSQFITPELILDRIEGKLHTHNEKSHYCYFIENNEDSHYWTGTITSDESDSDNVRSLKHYLYLSEVDREKFLSALSESIKAYKKIFRLDYFGEKRSEACITLLNNPVFHGVSVNRQE